MFVIFLQCNIFALWSSWLDYLPLMNMLEFGTLGYRSGGGGGTCWMSCFGTWDAMLVLNMVYQDAHISKFCNHGFGHDYFLVVLILGCLDALCFFFFFWS